MTISADGESLVKSLLKIPSVRIHDIEDTTRKLSKILQDGHKNLHIISDFDMTMSRHWVRNAETDALERNISSHGIPAKSKLISDEFVNNIRKLYLKYYPIEINAQMTSAEKLPYMKEWWTGVHETFIKENIAQQDVAKMASRVELVFRGELEKVLDHCKNTDIPFLVFSAGIRDIIEEILKHANLYTDNMHVVSNRMIFNKEGICYDFDEPLIHVLNKSEFQLEKTPYYSLIKERTNVLLMGDSLGDLQMSQGVAHDLCLNIGFLNHDIKELEPAYLKAFDIVIEGDANMSPVVEILNKL